MESAFRSAIKLAEGQEYVDQLRQDIELRKMIREETERAGVSRIEIERFPGKVKITVNTAKPGILIGRKGENVKKLRANLEGLVGKKIDLLAEADEVQDDKAYQPKFLLLDHLGTTRAELKFVEDKDTGEKLYPTD